MGEQKLEAFKVGDRVPRPESRSSAGKTPSPAESSFFSRLETLLENDDLPDVTARLEALEAEVAAYATANKGPRDQSAVKKATAALKRTRILMEHLYGVKARLIEAAQSANSAG